MKAGCLFLSSLFLQLFAAQFVIADEGEPTTSTLIITPAKPKSDAPLFPDIQVWSSVRKVHNSVEFSSNGHRYRLLGVKEADDPKVRANATAELLHLLKSNALRITNNKAPIYDVDGVPLVWFGYEDSFVIEMVKDRLIELNYVRHGDYSFPIFRKSGPHTARWQEWLWEAADPKSRGARPIYKNRFSDTIPSTEEITRILEKKWTVERIKTFCTDEAINWGGIQLKWPGSEEPRSGQLHIKEFRDIGTIEWQAGGTLESEHILRVFAKLNDSFWHIDFGETTSLLEEVGTDDLMLIKRTERILENLYLAETYLQKSPKWNCPNFWSSVHRNQEIIRSGSPEEAQYRATLEGDEQGELIIDLDSTGFPVAAKFQGVELVGFAEALGRLSCQIERNNQ